MGATRTAAASRSFELPVDRWHRATELQICSAGRPHMLAFHLSWLSFFGTFFSTFAAAPLMPYIAASLRLDRAAIALANSASVGGSVLSRLVVGYLVDTRGPRRVMSGLLLGTIPPIIGMMFVTDASGFTTCRFLIGLSMASFVACQAWTTAMFAPSVVGLANATAGGWGNVGGGACNLLMPFAFVLARWLLGDDDAGWRACFVLPAVLHFGLGLLTLKGRDLPDGNLDELEAKGLRARADGGRVLRLGLSNVNCWILTVLYGLSFGVELTVNNMMASYFYNRFR